MSDVGIKKQIFLDRRPGDFPGNHDKLSGQSKYFRDGAHNEYGIWMEHSKSRYHIFEFLLGLFSTSVAWRMACRQIWRRTSSFWFISALDHFYVSHRLSQ